MHATLLLETGASPKVTERQLRHANARTTFDVYAHVREDSHRQAVERAAKYLNSLQPKMGRKNPLNGVYLRLGVIAIIQKSRRTPRRGKRRPWADWKTSAGVSTKKWQS